MAKRTRANSTVASPADGPTAPYPITAGRKTKRRRTTAVGPRARLRVQVPNDRQPMADEEPRTGDDGEPAKLEETINVLPYQDRWINDDSPLKIAVWSRQSGKSFAAALRAVIKCLENRTQYIILSKGERQSRLFMEKVKDFCEVFKNLKELPDYEEFPESDEKTMEVYFPHNGSRIIGLPANPDTARGYSGHIVLDEFAFHGDAHKIFAACFPIITRGYSIEVISTPNGTAGKFYEIAKAAGLVGPGTRDSGLGAGENPSTQNPVPRFGPATRWIFTTRLRRGFPRTSACFAPVATTKRRGFRSTAASSSPTRRTTFPWN